MGLMQVCTIFALMEYIYVLRSAGGIYKIGYSKNPKARISAIRTANVRITVCGIYAGTKFDEQRLHDAYKAKRISNEWFALDTQDLADIEIRLNPAIQLSALRHLICQILTGEVKDNAETIRKKKAANIKNVALTDDEITRLRSRSVSLKTAKAIKAVWLQTPHFTGKQLADETGFSLRTIRAALPVFQSSPIEV